MQNTAEIIPLQPKNSIMRLWEYERVLKENGLPLDPAELERILSNFKSYFSKPQSAQEIFEAFQENMDLQLGSDNSCIGYANTFSCYLESEQTFNEESIYRFIRSEQAKGNSNSTINTKLSALRTCAKWATIRGIIPVNFMELIKPLKTHKKMKPVVELDLKKVMSEVDSICRHEWIALRNKAMIMLFAVCGVRVSELINIESAFVNTAECSIRLMVAKGNKERMIYYPDEYAFIIDQYIAVRSTLSPSMRESKYFFLSGSPNVKGGDYRLTRQGVDNIIKRHTGQSDHEVSCHKLRHYCGTTLYKKGADLLKIQEHLGHDNLESTKVYIATDEQDKKETAEMMNDIF